MELSATRAIEIIYQLFTDEQKELLQLKMGETIITFKEQLESEFLLCYPLYSEKIHRVKAARIINANKLNIEKLKKEQEIIDQLLNTETFYKASVQISDTERMTQIKGEISSNAKSLNATHTKSIGGTGAQATEYTNLIEKHDIEAESVMNKVMNLELNEGGIQKKEWITTKEEDGLNRTRLQDVPTVPAAPLPEGEEKPLKINLSITPPILNEDFDDEDAPMHEVQQSDARGTVASVTDSLVVNQKGVSSGKMTKQQTLSYEKAKSLEKQMNMQLFNLREKLINQFYSLFDREPLCL